MAVQGGWFLVGRDRSGELMFDDLRSALRDLEASGNLLRVHAPMSYEYELAAVLWRLHDGPTVLFENVEGYDVPVVGNLLNRRDKLAVSLGLQPGELQKRVVHALSHPIAPVIVDDAPCMHVRLAGDVDLTELFPIPTISEHDGGRYISAGVLICKNPETGQRNMAICRMQITAPGVVGVYMAPTHSRNILEMHRARGTRMEVAIAVGLHPGLMVASQFLTPLDETHIAGGLFGQPIRMARARTVDLEVPAAAEIVLEGVIDPLEEREEGPFGEFPGTYAPRRPNPVVRLTAVSTRENPIFQMIVGGRHPEHLVTGAIAREAGLFEAIQSVVPGVRAVRLTEGGVCRFHAVVSITKRFAGEGRLVILSAFAKQDLIKHVVVVDEDIDVGNAEDIEWAIATRVRGHEDVLIVPGMKSNPVDPMSIDKMITKVGVDATLPIGTSAESLRQVGVPQNVMDDIVNRWADILEHSPKNS
jgi:2,5-furandicarboxylate decarboxylase 1